MAKTALHRGHVERPGSGPAGNGATPSSAPPTNPNAPPAPSPPRNGFGGTISLRLILPFVRALAARGIDPSTIARAASLDPAQFIDPDGRLPLAAAIRLQQEALQATGDPALGLHAAELVRPGDFDALEYVARASSTMRASLDAVHRYIRLMHDASSIAHRVEGDEESWTISVSAPATRVSLEFALATIVLVGRSIVGKRGTPKRVLLAYPEPEDIREHARIFTCPIHWNAGKNSLVYDARQLDQSFSQTSPSLSFALERHAEKLLAELPRAQTFSARVREHVVVALRAGETSPASVAQRLRVSARTLRRRLQEEGATFSDLLSDVRRELSDTYLKDPSLTVAEIGFLLGYANASAFQRAFRRWYDTSPTEYRRRLGS